MDLSTLRQSELIKRALSGLVIVLSVIAGIILGSLPWLAVIAVISLFSLCEFYNLISSRAHISRGIGLILAVVILALSYTGLTANYCLPVISIGAFALILIEIIRKQVTGTSNVLWNLGATTAGIVFVMLPWTFMYLLRAKGYGVYILLALFICTWTCDVFAYIIGSKWGRNLLCERISPRKTWEGFWGGIAGALLGSIFIPYFYGLQPMPYLLIGVICGITGQLGDLGESILKREAGVKDSGKLIPGHGGFLDRFDSILVSGTITYLIFGVILG